MEVLFVILVAIVYLFVTVTPSLDASIEAFFGKSKKSKSKDKQNKNYDYDTYSGTTSSSSSYNNTSSSYNNNSNSSDLIQMESLADFIVLESDTNRSMVSSSKSGRTEYTFIFNPAKNGGIKKIIYHFDQILLKYTMLVHTEFGNKIYKVDPYASQYINNFNYVVKMLDLITSNIESSHMVFNINHDRGYGYYGRDYGKSGQSSQSSQSSQSKSQAKTKKEHPLKDHPKYDKYATLVKTLRQRKAQLDSMSKDDPDRASLVNEYNAGVRRFKKMKSKYNF